LSGCAEVFMAYSVVKEGVVTVRKNKWHIL